MSQFTASNDGEAGVTAKAETAAQEASGVTETVGHEAAGVARTGKEEVGAVASEAKTQFTQLLSQTGRQLSEQAAGQKQRLADGASAFGDDLSRMADADEGSGIAGDLVRRIATHASSAGRWLSDRDPQELLGDVKAFARRRPGAFIAGAALAGLVVGRLTRALAAGATSSATHANTDGSPGAVASDGPRFAAADAQARATEGVAVEADTPVYSRSAHLIDGTGGEQSHDRPDTV
ncbi:MULTISPECIES: hypothetical protein [Microbacterium]|jgi:hypothetical protein|uniref:hypothetical protein n=1 Tax=Microbacterium TaxID=33882 RepID=UPI001D178CB9|nr:hypothetical protein [Microbacterium testaceum]MCC4250290.1 hypothetical protein [Microbacterium testaceum]